MTRVKGLQVRGPAAPKVAHPVPWLKHGLRPWRHAEILRSSASVRVVLMSVSGKRRGSMSVRNPMFFSVILVLNVYLYL
jgi:hypothetical protein